MAAGVVLTLCMVWVLVILLALFEASRTTFYKIFRKDS